jgi:hypothetical protein
VKEQPFAEGLVLVQKTIDHQPVYGLRTTGGQEVIPIAYKALGFFDEGENYIFAKAQGGDYLFTRDGQKILDTPCYSISDYETYINFYGDGITYLYFKSDKRLEGPYSKMDEYYNYLVTQKEDNVTILDKDGNVIVSGNQIWIMWSINEQKRWFVVWTGNQPKGYSAEGKELYKLDPKRLDKLPRASWSHGENVKAISSRNPMEAFKK